MTVRTRDFERTPKVAVVDRLLLLCVHAAVRRAGGAAIGATLLQKIVFQARLRLRKRGATAPSWPFRRWIYGPYSAELVKDEQALASVALVEHGRISKRGQEILDRCMPLLKDGNRHYFEVVDEEAAKRAKWTAARAKREAYDLKVTDQGQTLTMAEAPMGVEFDLEPTVEPVPFQFEDEFLMAELQMEFSITEPAWRASKRYDRRNSQAVREILSGVGA